MIKMLNKKSSMGNSLAVQWLGPCAFIAAGTDAIPGQGTKIPQAVPPQIPLSFYWGFQKEQR